MWGDQIKALDVLLSVLFVTATAKEIYILEDVKLIVETSFWKIGILRQMSGVVLLTELKLVLLSSLTVQLNNWNASASEVGKLIYCPLETVMIDYI